ncbi:Tubulin binding cofactor C domain containing protein [Elaphomyces granulatus]
MSSTVRHILRTMSQSMRRPSPTDNQVPRPDISAKERFFRYFQNEITVLQEQMDRLANTSLVGGERLDATDHCLAGIVRLSNEVKDASSYIPVHDQRIYAEAIKALQDRLAETRTAMSPRTRFSFKTRKNASALSLTDAAEIAAQRRQHTPGDRFPVDVSSRESSTIHPMPIYALTSSDEPEQSQPRIEMAPTSSPARAAPLDGGKGVAGSIEETYIRQPSFSNALSVTINSHYGRYIMLPTSASPSTVPASIMSLRHCVVDMSIPTLNGKPHASLTIQEVNESLLVCGRVEGPVHITGVEHSVVVVSCRQFRMHYCADVDVYLSICSHPIIEDCKRIRFGKLPKAYALPHKYPDCWDRVEDFKWIKPEPSPNWSILDPNNAAPETVWSEMVPGGPCWSVDDILRATKVLND